jgi:BlaI family penicillinase repressor
MENLTNKEEEIMQAIWQLEKVFVKEIVAALPSAHHYNTISTIVRSLEKKTMLPIMLLEKHTNTSQLFLKKNMLKSSSNLHHSVILIIAIKTWSHFLQKKKKLVRTN